MIILENNLMRLKFYHGGFPKKCEYSIYDSSSNISYVPHMSRYIASGKSEYKDTIKLIEQLSRSEDDEETPLSSNIIYADYMKNLSFSIMDEDLLCAPIRVFINNDGNIFLGRLDGMDTYAINSITYFTMFYLSGVHLSICRALSPRSLDFDILNKKIIDLEIDLMERFISFSYYEGDKVRYKLVNKEVLGYLLYTGANFSYKFYVDTAKAKSTDMEA